MMTQTGAAVEDGETRAYQAGVSFFLGPIEALLADPDVSEIAINGPEEIYVERGGRLEQVDARFANEQALVAAATIIAQFVGKPLTEKEPILDGRLPDGSRVCIVLPPVAAGGTSINIRRFQESAKTPDFLLEKGSVTEAALEFLQFAIGREQNTLISGGTGSGKTTLLNILSCAFDPAQRVVVIEDTRELQIQTRHVVQMEARPADEYDEGAITVRDLFVTSLRMRPDRIVVGEVRRGEALDMIQAMTSGHRGSLATLHADSSAQACGRLEMMCMMADVELPLAALRRQIALGVDLIVQVSRLHSGRRMVTQISEIDMGRDGDFQVRDLFALDLSVEEPTLRWTGEVSQMAATLTGKEAQTLSPALRGPMGLEID